MRLFPAPEQVTGVTRESGSLRRRDADGHFRTFLDPLLHELAEPGDASVEGESALLDLRRRAMGEATIIVKRIAAPGAHEEGCDGEGSAHAAP
jgi:hypothetical protein